MIFPGLLVRLKCNYYVWVESNKTIEIDYIECAEKILIECTRREIIESYYKML